MICSGLWERQLCWIGLWVLAPWSRCCWRRDVAVRSAAPYKKQPHPECLKEEFDPLLLLLVIQDDNGRQAPLAQRAGEKVGFNVLPGTVGSKDWLVISPRRRSWMRALLKTNAGQRRKRLDKYDLCLFLLTCRCGLSDVNTIKGK